MLVELVEEGIVVELNQHGIQSQKNLPSIWQLTWVILKRPGLSFSLWEMALRTSWLPLSSSCCENSVR